MALREGSIMEGLFAMYCAAYLIDPNDGRNISEVKKVINSMRVQTEIRESTKTKGSLSVNYEKHYPRDRTFVNAFGTSVVNGKAAKEMVAPPSRRKRPIIITNASCIADLSCISLSSLEN